MKCRCAIHRLYDIYLFRLLAAAIKRELPAATLHVANADEPAQVMDALRAANMVIVPLAVVLNGPSVPLVGAFSGRRLLLPMDVPGYEVIGVPQNAETMARDAARMLRATLNLVPPPVPPSAPVLPHGVA